MSSIILNEYETSILSKGLKFCPTPEHYNAIVDAKDTAELCRKLRLTEFFHESGFTDNSIVKGKSNFNPPPGRNDYLEILLASIKKSTSTYEKE